jgi:hypothetical protein
MHLTTNMLGSDVRATLGFVFLSCCLPCFAQGTFTVRFDGYPVAQNTAVHVQQYTESGMLFTPIPGSAGFVLRNGPGSDGGLPDNGTTYVQCLIGDSLRISAVNGSTFSISSIDVAGYSDIVPNISGTFTGFHADGSTVTASFNVNSLAFQTLNFDGFNNLVSVQIPYFGSLDNLVVTPAPEPSSLVLLAVGGVLMVRKHRR